MRIPLSILIGASALSLGACATAGPYDNGGGLYLQSAYGSPYDSFSCGIDGWNNGFNNVYGYPGCGWYNGFFYPGSGRYMYDRNHGRHAWNGGGGQGHGMTPTGQPTFRAPGSNGGVSIGGGRSSFGGGFGGGRGFGGGGFGGGGSHGGGGGHRG